MHAAAAAAAAATSGGRRRAHAGHKSCAGHYVAIKKKKKKPYADKIGLQKSRYAASRGPLAESRKAEKTYTRAARGIGENASRTSSSS